MKQNRLLLRVIIFATALCSLSAPIFSHLLQRVAYYTPQDLMPLSLWGMLKGWKWQFFSYAFTHSADTNFSISLLIYLAVHLQLLYFTSQQILQILDTKRWFLLYALSWIGSGLFGGFMLWLCRSPEALYGCTPILYTQMTFYIFKVPSRKLISFIYGSITLRALAILGMGLFFLHQFSSHAPISALQLLFASGLGLLLAYLSNFKRKHFTPPISSPEDNIIDITPHLKK